MSSKTKPASYPRYGNDNIARELRKLDHCIHIKKWFSLTGFHRHLVRKWDEIEASGDKVERFKYGSLYYRLRQLRKENPINLERTFCKKTFEITFDYLQRKSAYHSTKNDKNNTKQIVVSGQDQLFEPDSDSAYFLPTRPSVRYKVLVSSLLHIHRSKNGEIMVTEIYLVPRSRHSKKAYRRVYKGDIEHEFERNFNMWCQEEIDGKKFNRHYFLNGTSVNDRGIIDEFSGVYTGRTRCGSNPRFYSKVIMPRVKIDTPSDFFKAVWGIRRYKANDKEFKFTDLVDDYLWDELHPEKKGNLIVIPS